MCIVQSNWEHESDYLLLTLSEFPSREFNRFPEHHILHSEVFFRDLDQLSGWL